MSGIEAGIPLWDGLGPHHSGDGRDYFGVMHYRDTPHAEDRREPTHRAYPVKYASQLEAVAECLDGVQDFLERVSEYNGSDPDEPHDVLAVVGNALDALAAAGSEAS